MNRFSDNTKIIEYNPEFRTVLKLRENSRSLTVSTTSLQIDITELIGRLEMEVAGAMIVTDIRALFNMINLRFDQLALLIERLEEE